ncbi:hypothetical protein D9M68_956690 [compost metagenome]
MLRQADRDFALAIRGQNEHALPRGHYLADLDHAPGDHAILRGAQHRVAGLIAGHVELGPDLLEARLT